MEHVIPNSGAPIRYHLVNDQHDRHKWEILSLSFLAEDSLQVALEQLHDKYIMIAFLAKPVNLWDPLYTKIKVRDKVWPTFTLQVF